MKTIIGKSRIPEELNMYFKGICMMCETIFVCEREDLSSYDCSKGYHFDDKGFKHPIYIKCYCPECREECFVKKITKEEYDELIKTKSL